jgi:hypothetical protein
VLGASGPADAARPNGDSRSDSHHDTSPPLRAMPQRGKATAKTAAVQSSAPTATSAAPVAGQSFDGVGAGFTGPQGTYTVNPAPPDTNSAVGPNQVVEIVDSAFAVFDKTGRVLYGPANNNTLWSGFGGSCQSTNGWAPPLRSSASRPARRTAGCWPRTSTARRFRPAGAPNVMLALGTTSTGPSSIAVAAYSQACNGGTCVPQLSTTNQLDSLADRLMFRLGYRNFSDHQSSVVSHSVTVNGAAAVRWYELRPSGSTVSVYQQGTYAPNSTYRWMPSVAMDLQRPTGRGPTRHAHPG